MIQEMEAWFLKQPECFEKWAEKEEWTRRASSGTKEISEYAPISGKNIEEITKPSEITAELMRHFFEKRPKSKKRRLAKYGKLTIAPKLLDNLDLQALEQQDSELQRFKANV